MYDVIYIDAEGAETPLAQRLGDRDCACEFARREAAERGAGRAMLPGSTNLRDCVCILPSPSLPSAA
jgi:hypothetical protein